MYHVSKWFFHFILTLHKIIIPFLFNYILCILIYIFYYILVIVRNSKEPPAAFWSCMRKARTLVF